MIEVKKKDRETSESLIRRFGRRVQQSGVLVQARKTRFRKEEKSKIEVRQWRGSAKDASFLKNHNPPFLKFLWQRTQKEPF